MNASPHFTLAGVPVRVEPLFFVVIAVLGLGYGEPVFIASWVVLAFISVLLHEFGHAAAFRLYGHQPAIMLHGFGGLTSAKAALTPKRSIVVSLAGPFSALLLIGLPAWLALASGAGEGSPALEVMLVQAVWINIGWSLLNLLPILPLDGGNVTASLLELATPRNGRRIAAGVSVVVALALGAAALYYGLIFGALIAGFFCFANLRELRARPEGGIAADALASLQSLVGGDAKTAEDLARRAMAAARHPDDQRWTRELVAWCRLFAGDAAPARQMVSGGATRPDMRPSSALEAGVALADGRGEEGLGVMAWALANESRPEARVLGAVLTARLGLAGQVTEELISIDGGRLAAVGLRDLLVRSGDAAAAAAVSERLDAAGPALS